LQSARPHSLKSLYCLFSRRKQKFKSDYQWYLCRLCCIFPKWAF